MRALVHNSDVRCESPRHGWEPFDVRQVVSLLDTVPVRWWLSGGAALDQFLGFASREHGDIDVSVVRSDWPLVQEALSPALDLWVAQRGALYPIDERDVDDKVHSIWARESEKGPWRVQFNLEDVTEGIWRYRRDSRIRLPVDELFWHSGQLRCVRPAVQMLWKSRTPTAKDEQDYEAVIPRLDWAARRWLGDAVLLAHPLSPWASRTELISGAPPG